MPRNTESAAPGAGTGEILAIEAHNNEITIEMVQPTTSTRLTLSLADALAIGQAAKLESSRQAKVAAAKPRPKTRKTPERVPMRFSVLSFL